MIEKVVALKQINNRMFGKILKDAEIPKRVYSKFDVDAYEKAGLIKVTRKTPKKKADNK